MPTDKPTPLPEEVEKALNCFVVWWQNWSDIQRQQFIIIRSHITDQARRIGEVEALSAGHHRAVLLIDQELGEAKARATAAEAALAAVTAGRDTLREELENIAHASMSDFEDYHEFRAWVQNRALIAATEVGNEK